MRDKPATSVDAIERAIQILDAFSVDRPELGVADISRALGLKRSTVHRALSTLETGGLLRQVPATQKYTLGSKVLKLAHVLQSQLTLSAIALPPMKDLRDRINETVALHLLEGHSRVVVEQVESTHDIRRTYHEVGKPLPLWIGSSGKAILAFLPAPELRQVLEEAATAGADDIAAAVATGSLARELGEIRQRGYCYSLGERTYGISSISCPVMNQEGRVVAAINISGPGDRFTREKAMEYLPALESTTRFVSRELGYAGPAIP